MPDLNYGGSFLESGVNNIRAHSWTDVLTPLQTIRTLLNDTGLNYENLQSYGVRHSNLRTFGAMTLNYVKIRNASGASITAGSLVYPSSIYSDGTNEYPSVSKAVVTSASGTSRYASLVLPDSVADGADSTAALVYELGSINTSASTINDPVYLSTTAGGYTFTAPVADNRIQIVGRVSYVHASAGRVIFDLPGHIIPFQFLNDVL